ncbi:hypothetical protein TcasGA2_TC034918, partial [Tribolium castaneum]
KSIFARPVLQFDNIPSTSPEVPYCQLSLYWVR